MSDRASKLSNPVKRSYGLKALRWYWNSLTPEKKVAPNFDKFVEAVYYNERLKKNFKDEDLPSYGEQVAMYLLDHPYADEDKLKENLKDLADATPIGKIPTKWSLSQAVVESASSTSMFDYFTISKTAIMDTGKEFRVYAIAGVASYFAYKAVLGGLTVAITAYVVAKSQSKSQSKAKAEA